MDLKRCVTAPDELKNDIKVYEAEMKFFRAYQYFNLLKRFGGVPLIEKKKNTLHWKTKTCYTDRVTAEKQLQPSLKRILMKQFTELPLESAISADDKGRISKGAAEAMKARFSLFEGTWRKYHGLQGADAFLDDAISAAKNVINSNEYELWDHRAELGDWSYKYFFTLSKIKIESCRSDKS